MNLFSFNFPLREYLFCTSPAPPSPPPPYKFSNGPSLRNNQTLPPLRPANTAVIYVNGFYND